MSPRHLARAIILQTLFIWDFNNQDSDKIDFYVKYNLQEFAPYMSDAEFIIERIKNTIAFQPEIDKVINQYAIEWPVERLAVLDRNILRLAIFETFNHREIPAKVALNEAVELAKEYGGASSQKFVSGVMGAIYDKYFKYHAEKLICFRKKT